jgi:flagellar basal body rod protein FlgB
MEQKMGSESAIEAVRLSLAMHELRAKVASQNIANVGTAGARAFAADLSGVKAALNDAARQTRPDPELTSRLSRLADELHHRSSVATGAPIREDEQVGEMVATATGYQTLTEALGRQLGLMRLAITGRN